MLSCGSSVGPAGGLLSQGSGLARGGPQSSERRWFPVKGTTNDPERHHGCPPEPAAPPWWAVPAAATAVAVLAWVLGHVGVAPHHIAGVLIALLGIGRSKS
jgi:hypothetical protein